jgi:hypothetical protein
MKLEIKLLFILVGLFIVAQPVLLDAAVRPGDPGYKEPWIAFWLSILLPGLGHLWVGEGMTFWLILGIGAYVAWFVLWWAVSWSLWYIFWLGVLVLEVMSGLDAMRAARAHNSRGGRLALTDTFTPAVVPVI